MLLCSHYYVGDDEVSKRSLAYCFETVVHDAAYFIRSLQNVFIAEIEEVFKFLFEAKERGSLPVGPNSSTLKIGQQLEIDALSVFLSLIKRHILFLDNSKVENRSVQFLSSTYLRGTHAPFLSCLIFGSSAVLLQTSTRVSERIVAKLIYFGSRRGRCDTVKVNNSESIEAFDFSEKISFWFATVLLFVRLCSIGDSRHFHEHSRRNCPACSHEASREFCFIKYEEEHSVSTFLARKCGLCSILQSAAMAEKLWKIVSLQFCLRMFPHSS